MLTLKLTLDNGQVAVCANKAHSHSFSLHDLRLNDSELKAFVLNPRPYGSRLFQALFKDGSAAKTAFDELSKQTARTIVLVLDSPDPSTSLRTGLDGIAWEYAYNEVKQEYVVEDCAFMRALPESERPANGRLKESVERVSLLFIPANPLMDLNAEPMRALDVDGEWREMNRHITASHAPFDLLQLRPATPEQLQTSMARFRDGLVVHFSGHGAAMKDGTILLFERENGASNPLGAQEFIRAVKDKAGIVFLSACQSAAAEKTEFGNLARGLVKSGVPFALGMQFNLPDPFAPVISGQFYNWLAQGHAIPEATMQARRAVKRENEFFVGMIALYAAHPDETGKLNWRGSGASLVQTVPPADVSDLPSPASGLIGRQRELMRIGTQLIEAKKPLTMTLHGAGGIGKTALLLQSLLRFAPSFELTIALALDPLPSLESIIRRIERFLGLPSPCANETKERETLVREMLTSKRTLLGLDNFETLNYALNEKDSDEEKTSKSLHAFFKSLAANGVTMCVTSREVTNLPGETIEDIQGLTNENGGRLFQENVVRQKDEIYIEKTQQVSEMVGGHPLALRLLASAFDDQVGRSLDQYIEDLQSFLPKARDKWTEEVRHESLRASFDFTMNNLVKTEGGVNLQSALAKLSVFVAFFAQFTAALVLEKIPESETEYKEMGEHAEQVLNALWERGLLERKVLALEENESFYLYRLYPVLNQFAAIRVSSKNQLVLQETHRLAMRHLAEFAYPGNENGGIYRIPQLSTVVYYAIPDLLKASKLSQDKEAVVLLFLVAFFQMHFGNMDDAIKLYQQSINIGESLNDLDSKNAALYEMANILVKKGKLDEALNLYHESLELMDRQENAKNKSSTLHAMAKVYFKWGNLDEAMRLYQQALEIQERLGDKKGKADSLHSIANIYATQGNLDGAKDLLVQSLELSKEIGDFQSISDSLHGLAAIFAIHGDLDTALNLYQQSLELSEGLFSSEGKSHALYEMANIFVTRGDIEKALMLYEESLKISDKLGNLEGKSALLNAIANIHAGRGNLDEAMKLYKQSLEIEERQGNPKGIANELHNIAIIYSMRGLLDEAMRLFTESLELSENLGDLKSKSETLNGIANIYVARKDLERAKKLFGESLELSKKLRDQEGMASALRELAIIHAKQGNLDNARDLFVQSFDISDKLGDIRGKSSTLCMFGQLLIIKGYYPSAISAFLQSLENFLSISAKPDAESVARILVEFRQKVGAEVFDNAWKDVSSTSIPQWLL